MAKRLNANQKRMRDAACRKHTGKMTNLMSISTSPFNWLCNLRAAIVNSICAHCFSRRMMKRYPALAEKLRRNADWLTSYEIKPEDVYHFNPKSGYFRFEAYGDLFDTLQVKNYFTIANELNKDGIKCALLLQQQRGCVHQRKTEVIQQSRGGGTFTRPDLMRMSGGNDMKYEIRFINGHTMRYEVRKVDADNQAQAISKLWDDRGDFDHQIISVTPIEPEPLKFKALGYEIEIKATKYDGEDNTLTFMNEIMDLLSHTEDALRARNTENSNAVADIRWREFAEIYDQLDALGYLDDVKNNL